MSNKDANPSEACPVVSAEDVGYPDTSTAHCVRPEAVESVNDFMKFIQENCDLDELE